MTTAEIDKMASQLKDPARSTTLTSDVAKKSAMLNDNTNENGSLNNNDAEKTAITAANITGTAMMPPADAEKPAVAEPDNTVKKAVPGTSKVVKAKSFGLKPMKLSDAVSLQAIKKGKTAENAAGASPSKGKKRVRSASPTSSGEDDTNFEPEVDSDQGEKVSKKKPAPKPKTPKTGSVSKSSGKSKAASPKKDKEDASNDDEKPPPKKRATPSKKAITRRAGLTFEGCSMSETTSPAAIMYNTTVYAVTVKGHVGPYHLHESKLVRSPVLCNLMAKAKQMKRTSAKQSISVDEEEDKTAFTQMVDYLYTDNFTPAPVTTTAGTTTAGGGPAAVLQVRVAARMKEFLTLTEMAKNYQLPGLQDQIASGIKKMNLISKLSPEQFFEWSEKMLNEEIQREDGRKGGLTRLFDEKAPAIIVKMSNAQKAALGRSVCRDKDSFEAKIFHAAMNALQLAHTPASRTAPTAAPAASYSPSQNTPIVKKEDHLDSFGVDGEDDDNEDED